MVTVRRMARIVVAVDESEESMRALKWACKYFCANDQYNFLLLHVQPNNLLLAGPVYLASDEVVNIVEYNPRRTTQKVFKRSLDICHSNDVKAETQVVIGDPKKKICEAVENLRADFLVVGCHGYGGFIRAIRGSVSDYCSKNAVCPVVVVNDKIL